MKNTFGDYEFKCPYCECELDPAEFFPKGECAGSASETQCPSCEKNFEASFDYVFNTKANCKLNELKCNFVPDDSMNIFERVPKYFKCEHCGKDKRI